MKLSTAFHSQTDGEAESTIQTLEDMMRACVIDFTGSLDDQLPLIDFSYNNSYHANIRMDRLRNIMVGGVGLLLGGSRLESHPFWV